MLFNLSDKQIFHLPHKLEFDARRKKLSDESYDTIVSTINEHCDAYDTVKSAYFSSKDRIRSMVADACVSDDETRMFLGQILWLLLQERSDKWTFYRGDSGDDQVAGMTYFKMK